MKNFFRPKFLIIALVLCLITASVAFRLPKINLPIGWILISAKTASAGAICEAVYSEGYTGWPIPFFHLQNTSSCSGNIYFNVLGAAVSFLFFLLLVNIPSLVKRRRL